MRAVAIAVFSISAVVTACSSAPPDSADVSMPCGPNGECGTGLTCIADYAASEADSSCFPYGQRCSIPCSGDDECTSALGSGFMCISDCAGSAHCDAPGAPDV